MKYKIENQLISTIFPKIVFILFFSLSVMISLGNIDRWILSEPIAMAENYLINNSFYPQLNQENISGVSVYPPGLAILSVFVLQVGLGNYIFELLLTLSTLMLILFLYIQKKLFEEIFDSKITVNELLIYIILITALLPRWYDYSLQFKPSIIGQILGFSILYSFLKLKTHKEITYSLFLGILFSIPIIFKQQYISFIIGFLFYTLFKRNLKNIVFCLGSLMSLASLIFIPDYKSMKFWNYEILRDDGITPLLLIFSEHYLVLVRAFFFIGFSILVGVNFKIPNNFSTKFLFNKFIENPLFPVMFFSFFSVYLGLYKAGGNDGNIDGAILFLTPFIFSIFKRIPQKYLIFFAFVSVLSLLPKAYLSIEDYIDMVDFQNSIQSINIEKNIKLVTDSNAYFASRVITNKHQLDNFHAYSLTLPGQGSPNLRQYIESKLKNIDYYLFIEHSEVNRLILADLGIEIIYENNSGIIATNTNLNDE